jgi:hypothetical protein
MMTEPQLDARGEAHEALSSVVAAYGPPVLSNPRMLGSLVTDLLPDLPRERSLLVTAAEAGIASELTQRVRNEHVDPGTAVRLVAWSLVERKSIDPGASTWVTTEYAQALGHPVRADALPPPIGPAYPPQEPAFLPQERVTTYGQYGSTQPIPGSGAAGGYPAPPMPPAPPARRRRRWPVFAAIGTAAVVVIFAVTAFAGGLFKSTPAPTVTLTHPPTHRVTTPAPRTRVASLIELLPADINHPAGQCSQTTPDFTPVGLTQAIQCNDPGLPNGSIEAYQMNSYASYRTSWANFNKWWGFASYSPGSTCPPAGSDRAQAEGTTGWYDLYFPQRQGQVLECEWTETGNTLDTPAYAWTFPSENAFIIAYGPQNSTFATLSTWWTNHADPAAAPAPAASPST